MIVAVTAAMPAQAADRYWNAASVGGSEDSSYDIWDTANWDGAVGSGNALHFAVSEKTYIKSTSNTQVGNDFDVYSGDFVFIGPLYFLCYKSNQANATSSVVKKGDWTIKDWGMRIGSGTGTTVTFTNESGNVSITGNKKDDSILSVASGANSTVTVVKEAGDWSVSMTFFIGNGAGATGRFYNRGGNVSGAARYGVCLGSGAGDARDAYLEISGGRITNTGGHLCIGDGDNPGTSTVYVTGNGEYLAQAGWVFVGSRGASTLTINQNGLVKAPANGVQFCANTQCVAGRDCFLNLNGGTLETKTVTYGSGAAAATFTFNGGTLKALQTGTLIAAHNNLSVKVGNAGGTIDTAGFDVTIAEDLDNATGETGSMTFKGGGKATLNVAPTYTGVTTVEIGTTLVVPSAIAGSSLAFTIPASGLTKGVYEVVRISDGGVFADDVLTGAMLPADASAQFTLNADKTAIVCVYGYATDENAYIGGSGGSLSVAENWLSGSVPTSGNITFAFQSATTVEVGDTFRADTITIPDTSAVMTIGAGNLHISGSLTNVNNLAIASGASLTVDGDLVGYAANNTMPILYSNEGTVTVCGTVHFRSSGANKADSTVSQYAVADEKSTPIIANRLSYNADSWSDWLVANLGSMGNGPGKWVIGAGGLTIPSSRIISQSGFRAKGSQSVVLHSSADWTLAESYRHAGNDLCITDTANVTIDTTDWNDGATPRTVTLNGYVNATSTHETPLTITGCGTLVLNQTAYGSLSNRVNNVLAVLNGATLKVNAGKSIVGLGTISLAAGTTLALESTDREFATPDIVPVTLPAEGAATIKIDGTRLRSGKHVLCALASVPENLSSRVIVTGTALDGRKYKVETEEVTEGEKTVTKLVANIKSAGLTLIFR